MCKLKTKRFSRKSKKRNFKILQPNISRCCPVSLETTVSVFPPAKKKPTSVRAEISFKFSHRPLFDAKKKNSKKFPTSQRYEKKKKTDPKIRNFHSNGKSSRSFRSVAHPSGCLNFGFKSSVQERLGKRVKKDGKKIYILFNLCQTYDISYRCRTIYTNSEVYEYTRKVQYRKRSN